MLRQRDLGHIDLKKKNCFRLVQNLGEGSRWLKSCPVATERHSGRNPDTRGMQRGSSKATGLQKLLVVLESETFEKIFTQPSLQRLVRWSHIFLMNFTCCSRKPLSRKSELGVCAPRAPDPKGPGADSFP